MDIHCNPKHLEKETRSLRMPKKPRSTMVEWRKESESINQALMGYYLSVAMSIAKIQYPRTWRTHLKKAVRDAEKA